MVQHLKMAVMFARVEIVDTKPILIRIVMESVLVML